MSNLFIYLIKANVALTLFYLAYRFGLRRLTFYTLNRYFLLFGIIFAAIIPLLDTTVFFQHHEKLAGGVSTYSINWGYLEPSASHSTVFSPAELLQYLFWAGVALMSIRFIMQLFSLLRIYLQTEKGKINGEDVKLTTNKINPFSFFKTIYINPELHTSKEIKNILAHENIHIKGWHSLDVLISEVNLIFYWFNPGAWLMKTAVHENLEFITDHQLLKLGVNIRDYQYDLLKTAGLIQRIPMTNNFNFSHLKKRIQMMNKKQSSGFHLFRYLLLLPLITIAAIFVTASRGEGMNNAEGQRVRADTLPGLKAHLPAYYKSFMRRNPAIEAMKWTHPKAPIAIIQLKNGKTERYLLTDTAEMKKAKAKYGKLPAPPPPPPPMPGTENPPGEETQEGSAHLSANVIFIIDGHRKDSSALKHLSPNSIQSIAVLKGEKAIQEYGRKGKNGVVLIYTTQSKTGDKQPGKASRDSMKKIL